MGLIGIRYLQLVTTMTFIISLGIIVGIFICPYNDRIENQPEVQTQTENDSIIATVVSVYDGDTFTVDVIGWPDIIGDDISIRVNGIDTPERRGTNEDIKILAEEAREATLSFLDRTDSVELRNVKRCKYFRIIADVYIDDQSLAGFLLDKGLAKPYNGGTRPEWTEEDYNDFFRNN